MINSPFNIVQVYLDIVQYRRLQRFVVQHRFTTMSTKYKMFVFLNDKGPIGPSL